MKCLSCWLRVPEGLDPAEEGDLPVCVSIVHLSEDIGDVPVRGPCRFLPVSALLRTVTALTPGPSRLGHVVAAHLTAASSAPRGWPTLPRPRCWSASDPALGLRGWWWHLRVCFSNAAGWTGVASPVASVAASPMMDKAEPLFPCSRPPDTVSGEMSARRVRPCFPGRCFLTAELGSAPVGCRHGLGGLRDPQRLPPGGGSSPFSLPCVAQSLRLQFLSPALGIIFL